MCIRDSTNTQAQLHQIEPSARAEEFQDNDTPTNYPLGAARAQIHENYIIAQSDNGLVIVDQHAAHERLVYEKLKDQMDSGDVISQGLLVPELIDLPDTQMALLETHQETLNAFGLFIENFGTDSVCVQSLPAALGLSLIHI